MWKGEFRFVIDAAAIFDLALGFNIFFQEHQNILITNV